MKAASPCRRIYIIRFSNGRALGRGDLRGIEHRGTGACKVNAVNASHSWRRLGLSSDRRERLGRYSEACSVGVAPDAVLREPSREADAKVIDGLNRADV